MSRLMKGMAVEMRINPAEAYWFAKRGAPCFPGSETVREIDGELDLIAACASFLYHYKKYKNREKSLLFLEIQDTT